MQKHKKCLTQKHICIIIIISKAEVNPNLKRLQRLGKDLIDQYKKEVQPKLYWLPEGA